MARAFVSYSHADREFVRKLAQDLTNHAVEVWLDEWQLDVGREIKASLDDGIAAYDYFFIVLSRTSVASDWVRHELDVALKKEVELRSALVLPILLEPVTAPPALADRAPIDFTAAYPAGLQALLGRLSCVNVKTVARAPHVEVISARRGVTTVGRLRRFTEQEAYEVPSAGSLHRIAMTGFVGSDVDVWAVIESIGAPEVALELTNGAAHIVAELVNRQLISRRRDDITRLFNIVDAGAKDLNQRHELRGVHRVSCKMGLLVAGDGGATTAAVGRTGVVVVSRSSIAFKNPRFEARLGPAIRGTDGASFMRAPLGYLLESSLQVEEHQIGFDPGDYVALTSFTVPAHDEDISALSRQLSEADGPSDIAHRLVESRWPPVADAFVCLVHRLG